MPPPWPAPDPATIDQYPQPPTRRRSTTLALAAAAGAGIALLALGTTVATRGDRGGGVDAPDEWDPRVVDIAADVEAIRGLDFDHPIAVSFLPEDEFVQRVTTDDDVSGPALDEAETYEAVLRASGLIEGDVDLAEENDQLAAGGVLGFYDPGTEELVVRGDELDPLVLGTLVHELTHALQDQHFDLSEPLSTESDGEYTGARSLIEADAIWVEEEWIADLPADEVDEYTRLEGEFIAAGDIDEAPPVLVEAISFPYVFGPLLHATLLADGGLERVDEAFAAFPTSEEQVLFPARYLDDDDPELVELPAALDDDEGEILDEGAFGAFGLFQVLGARLDFAPTMVAVEGWGGDAYRVVRRDRTTCLDLAVSGDTAEDLAELVAAFEEWADGAEGASVATPDGLAVLSTCDPGDRLPEAPNRTETGSAFDALALRTLITTDAMNTAGLDAETAQCVGESVVDEIGVDGLSEITELVEDDPGAMLPDELLDAVTDAVGAC